MKRTPLALIGIGCRLPGMVNNAEDFWRVISTGVDTIGPVPEERWDQKRYYDADPQRPGKLYVKESGFLTQTPYEFDPQFFGITPREAMTMDPQQRLILETAWEAIENSGTPLSQLQSQKTGVFIGGFCLDSRLIQLNPVNKSTINTFTASAVTLCILSNRVSHALNLTGPSISIDTACSSSLVATHMACLNLWSGDCDTALVGGVNIMLLPETVVAMCKGQFLSKQSRCMSFDISADGYVRGEGAGVILLKKLDQAIADNDRIYAVISEAGVNQDGKTLGLSLPNATAQEELITAVYAKAGVKPEQLDYIEAHGTGTQQGDAAEMRSLASVFRNRTSACPVGSVKTNFGHLEAGAGVVSLIKAALSLHHKQVAPNLNFNHPNPAIPFDEINVRVPTKLEPLPTDKDTHFVGVNSFGYGGTNAHVLLQSAPAHPKNISKTNSALSRFILPLSARSENALKSTAAQFLSYLNRLKTEQLSDVLYTLIHRRTHHNHRLAITALDFGSLASSLQNYCNDVADENIVQAKADAEQVPEVIFIYTGMGPQWWGMGNQLIQSNQIFRATVEECDKYFKELASWSLFDAFANPKPIEVSQDPEYAQPLNFVLQLGLTRILDAWQIKPDQVLGHSVGEIAAAHIAGALSLKDALTITFHRSRLQQSLAGKGAMLATEITSAHAELLLETFPDVSIAAINAERAITLSGSPDSLKVIHQSLEDQKLFSKLLRVDVAYHSPQMHAIEEAFIKALESVAPSTASITITSTVTGKPINGEAFDKEYWWKNARQTVLFAPALENIVSEKPILFIEIGPHPVTKPYLTESLKKAGNKGYCLHTLHRKVTEEDRLYQLLAELYTSGYELQWSNILPKQGELQNLPSYPWDRQYYNLETDYSRDERISTSPFAFTYQKIPGPSPRWEVELNAAFFPFLADHQLENNVVFPGAAYVEAGLQVLFSQNNQLPISLTNVQFDQLLVLNTAKTQKIITEYDANTAAYTVWSTDVPDASHWTKHASGYGNALPNHNHAPLSTQLLQEKSTETIAVEALYEQFNKLGFQYGPHFRSIQSIDKLDDARFIAYIKLPTQQEEDQSGGYLLHPAVLDCAFQVALASKLNTSIQAPMVPVGIGKINLYEAITSSCWAYIQILKNTPEYLIENITLFNDDGQICAELYEFACQKLPGPSSLVPQRRLDILFDMIWQKTATLTFIEQHALVHDEQPTKQISLISFDENVLSATLKTKLENTGYIVSATYTSVAHADAKKLSFDTQAPILVILPKIKGYESLLDYLDLLTQWVNLLKTSPTHQPRLLFITQGTVNILPTDSLNNPLASAIMGLNFILNTENHYFSTFVDLPEAANMQVLRALIHEIHSSSLATDVAFREDGRYQWEMKPHQQFQETAEIFATSSTQSCMTFQQNAFYLCEQKAPDSNEIEFSVESMLKIHPESSMFEYKGVVTRVGNAVQNFSLMDPVIYISDESPKTYLTVPASSALNPNNDLAKAAPQVLFPALLSHYMINMANQLRQCRQLLIFGAKDILTITLQRIAEQQNIETFVAVKSADLQQSKQFFSYDSPNFEVLIKNKLSSKGFDLIINLGEDLSALHHAMFVDSHTIWIELHFSNTNYQKNIKPILLLNPILIPIALTSDLVQQQMPMQVLLAAVAANDTHNADSLPTLAASELVPGQNLPDNTLIKLSNQNVPVTLDRYKLSRFNKDGTYIITGGTQGLGLELAKWLAKKGARRIVLLSRSGIKSESARKQIDLLCKNGSKIIIEQADISDLKATKRIIQLHNQEAAIAGIFHCAMVLDDGFLKDMSRERYHNSLKTKVKGTLNLIESCQDLSLDYFLVMSSLSSLLGTLGQANYIAANAFIDGLVNQYQASKLPISVLNIGVLADVGVIARNTEISQYIDKLAINKTTPTEVLDTIEAMFAVHASRVCMMDLKWEQWLTSNQMLSQSSRFKALFELIASESESNAIDTELKALLSGDKEENMEVLCDTLREVVADIFKAKPETLDLNSNLNNLGMDSLMVSELRGKLLTVFNVEVSLVELLKGLSISQLAEVILDKLGLCEVGT